MPSLHPFPESHRRTLAPPFLTSLPAHHFDSAKDGELQGSPVAHIVKARGQLRTVTAALTLPHGALVSVAVEGSSCVEVEMDPDVYILRFGVGGRFRYETRRQNSGHSRNILLSPGTRFHSFGEDESSLLLALHRRPLEQALGLHQNLATGINALPKIQGSILRHDAFTAARDAEQLAVHLRAKFLRNFQSAVAAAIAALLREIVPAPRLPDPMIGRRKVTDLCQWAALEHDQPVTVGDLAARCGLGLRALQKNFLRHFDTTPHLYLRNLRLDKVHRLLQDASTEWSVTAAALEAGFPHLGRFALSYRRKFGESPRDTLRRTQTTR